MPFNDQDLLIKNLFHNSFVLLPDHLIVANPFTTQGINTCICKTDIMHKIVPQGLKGK